MSKHRFMIELINKEDALDACRAEVWEGEALADINSTKPVLTIPENPTNGDMINALFPNAKNIRVDGGYLLNYIIEGEWHRNLKEWWNAPYNAESEVTADDGNSN